MVKNKTGSIFNFSLIKSYIILEIIRPGTNQNVGIGFENLYSNISGNQNIAIGYRCGDETNSNYNILIGVHLDCVWYVFRDMLQNIHIIVCELVIIVVVMGPFFWSRSLVLGVKFAGSICSPSSMETTYGYWHLYIALSCHS